MVGDPVDWHLKKEVSYGHLVSTLVLAGMLVASWVDVQQRLSVLENHPDSPAHEGSEARLDILETELARVHAIDAAIQLRIEDIQSEILRRLDRQDVKLDRIEDRLNQHDRVNK